MSVLIPILLIPAGWVILTAILWFIYHIPIRMDLSFSNLQSRYDLFLSIGWGLFSIRISRADPGWVIEVRISQRPIFSSPVQERELEPDPAPKTTEGITGRDIFRFLPDLIRFLPRLIRHIRLNTITADLTFGAGDPVTTGYTYGYYHAIRPLITSENRSITLIPDFHQMILKGTLQAGIGISTPAGLLIRGARIILPQVIRMRRDPHA